MMVGMAVKGIVWGGYGLTGFYAIKTGIRYVRDYKDAIENERG